MSVAAPDRLVGVVTPRLWTPPLRELAPGTSAGFEAAEFAEGVLGVSLIPWQRWLLEHMLELRPDGRFRFRTVVILVARQNGKTTLSQVLSLWRMYVDKADLVIGTAQSLDTSEEAWQATVDLAESVPDLAAEIAAVDRTNGKKALRLTSGERYKVAAASRRGGRGLSGDLVLLDELREHQKWDAWAAVTKTTMARPRAQIVCTSNAGDVTSVVLSHLRAKALGELQDGGHERSSLGLFEWSAPDGCDIWDRDGWIQANPSMGYTITEDAIASAAGTDPESVLRTEVLCQWVEQLRPAVFQGWDNCADPESRIADGSPVAFAVDVSWNRSTAWVAVAGRRDDGVPHVEVAHAASGTDWVTLWLAERVRRWNAVAVAVQSSGAPAASLVDELTARLPPGLLTQMSGMDMGRAAGLTADAASAGSMRHLGDPQLRQAVAEASPRTLGDSWVIDRRRSTVDTAGLVACTQALWALMRERPAPPRYAPRRIR